MSVVYLVADVMAGRVATCMTAQNLQPEFRIAVPEYHHGLRPRVETFVYWPTRISFTTNSLGFRDSTVRDVPLKHSGERLLFLGDSFTEGLGVTHEESFVGRIQAALLPQGIDVLNSGVASYSPKIYHAKTRHLLDTVRLEFDEAIVFLDVSDIADDALRYTKDSVGNIIDASTADRLPLATGITDASLKIVLKQNSLTLRLLDLVKDRLEGSTWRRLLGGEEALLEELVNMPHAAWTVDERLMEDFGRRGLAESEAEMTGLVQLLRERGIRTSLVVYPWPTQLRHRDPECVHINFWKEWAARERVRFLDLSEAFWEGDWRDTLEKYYIPWDCHWNADGHAFVAERFLQWR